MTQFTIPGHDLLAVERFRDDTRHMIEFEVLKDDNLIALRGETARLFLNERGYAERCGGKDRRFHGDGHSQAGTRAA